MLSRVAQNIYWLARYIERAEDTARLISVNANLLLDLPGNTAFGWAPVLLIIGNRELFEQRYAEANELNVVKFLIGDHDNPGSLISSLSFARENLRTTRDVVPREAWEQINDLTMRVRERLEMGMSRRGRYEFLKQVIQGAQQITGLLAGTMSHTHAYEFVRIGRNLERADMTTRIVDVRSANLLLHPAQSRSQGQAQMQSQSQALQSEEQIQELPFESIQWMSVLKSLTAYQMYRQQVRLRVRGPDVLKFLLQDRYFPRSVGHCLGVLEECLGRLPRTEPILNSIARLEQRLVDARVPELADQGLHEFIDDLQIGLGEVHEQITATYFTH